MPSRSETNARCSPSGPHCGEMFFPFWPGSNVICPLSTSRTAIFGSLNRRFSRSVPSPASVTNAIRFPSGDH